MRLARDRLGKQRLTGAGRADQQCALGELCADGGVFLRVVQKVNDLNERFLCLVLTRNVAEGHARLLFHIDLGAALSDAAKPADTAQSAPAASGDEAHQQGEQKEQHHGKNDP